MQRIVMPLFGGPTWTVTFYDNSYSIDLSGVTIRHIAHGLARVNRFCGQTPRAYSVAEHSVLLAEWSGLGLSALLHDAGEALGVADAHGGLKKVLAKRLRSFEADVVGRLWDRLGDGSSFPTERLKACDSALGDWEARFFGFPNSYAGQASEPPWEPRCYDAEFAEMLFLQAWIKAWGTV